MWLYREWVASWIARLSAECEVWKTMSSRREPS